MTDYYVRSSTGDSGNTGLSWSQAKSSLYDLIWQFPDMESVVTVGDRIFIAHNSTETWYQGFGWFGLNIGPQIDQESNGGWDGQTDGMLQIISVDDTGDPEPPTTWLAGAKVRLASSAHLWLRGPVYCYGVVYEADQWMKFEAETPSYPSISTWKRYGAVWDHCTFKLTSSAQSERYIGFNMKRRDETYFAECFHDFYDCTFDLSPITAGVIFVGSRTSMVWHNCILSTASGQQYDPIIMGGFSNLEMYGCDLSDVPSSLFIVGYAPVPTSPFYPDYNYGGLSHCIINRCKLPASFSGCFRGSSTTYPMTGEDFLCGEMYYSANSGNIDSRIFQWSSLRGNAYGESTYVRSGGADNGSGSYSIKVVTASAGSAMPSPYFPFCLKPIKFYCFETGSKTFSFEILHDSATDLTDKDVWVEVLHMGAAVPGSTTRSLPHTLASATALPAGVGTGSWYTTGMSNPKSQKLSVAVNIDHEQIIEFQIKIGKSSKVLYIDPLVTVS